MEPSEYWIECLSESLHEHGISATPKQIESVAGDVQGAHENYGMAYPTPPNPLLGENEELRRKLKAEQEKVVCPECKGSGEEVIAFGPVGRVARSQCFRCRGEGKCAQ